MESPIESKVSTEEAELLHDWRGKFMQAYRHEQEWRKERKRCCDFYAGEQWTKEEQYVLEQRGQPAVTINRIKPKVDAMIGVQEGIRVDTKAFNTKLQSFDQATHVTELLRYIERQSNFDRQESLAFEDVLKGGRAWYEVEKDFRDLEPEIVIKKAWTEDIYADPFGRQEDLSDYKFIFKTIWADDDDANELFPGNKDFFDSLVAEGSTLSTVLGEPLREFKPDQYAQPGNELSPIDLSLFSDKKRQRVRLITIYYRQPVRTQYAIHPDLGLQNVSDMSEADINKLKKNFEGVLLHTDLKYRLNCATFVANRILEHKKDIRPYDPLAKFPFVLVPGHQTDDDDRRPFGMIKQMLDPQVEINKRRSKMLHFLQTNQVIYEKGAVDNVTRAKMELAKPDGWVETNPQFRFEIQRNLDLAASQFQLLQEAKQEIDEAGINRELEGQNSNATSGRAIMLRQQQATQSQRRLFANLREARKRAFGLALEEAQRFLTQERVLRITGDDEAPPIVINQRMRDDMGNEVIDPNTGKPVVVNSLQGGKYDIFIEEAPETLNLQSEQFEKLTQLATAGFPIPMEMIIESSMLTGPNKKRILEGARQQQAAQAQAMQAQAMAAGQGPAPVA